MSPVSEHSSGAKTVSTSRRTTLAVLIVVVWLTAVGLVV